MKAVISIITHVKFDCISFLQYLRQTLLNFLHLPRKYQKFENIKWASVIFEEFYWDKFGNLQLQAGGQQTFFF